MRRFDTQRSPKQIVLAQEAPENVARPNAALRCDGIVNEHRLQNAKVDLGAVPAIHSGSRRNRVELLEAVDPGIEVEAIHRPMLDRIDRIVHRLSLLRVWWRDMQHDRNRTETT